MIWKFIERVSVIASVLSFPLTIIGLLGLYVTWSRDAGYLAVLAAVILFVGLVAYGIDLSDRFNWFKPSRTDLQAIYSQSFSNEVVQVDGKHFINCTFTNVTFRYDKGNYTFENPVFTGSIGIETNNDDVQNGIWLLKYLDSNAPGLVATWRKQPKK